MLGPNSLLPYTQEYKYIELGRLRRRKYVLVYDRSYNTIELKVRFILFPPRLKPLFSRALS
jgi:hypothetical protein